MSAPSILIGSKKRCPSGFTLIELLVVLAIIAILTAILLPVFSVVLENSRQSTSISNIKQISTALAQFRLDNHRDPDVLFGYAVPSGSMKSGPTSAIDTTVPGLYPEYIKDYSVFTDPNNPIDDPTAQVPADVNVLGSNKMISAVSKQFYKMDAYDVSPTVTGANAVDNSTFKVRYNTSWTNIGTFCTGTNIPAGCDATITPASEYNRQLRWKNPPSDTYVDLTTYHVPNADRVLIMLEDGSVAKMRGEDFAANWENNNFWTVKP